MENTKLIERRIKVGKELSLLRRSKGFSQENIFGEKNQPYVSKMEAGSLNYGIDSLFNYLDKVEATKEERNEFFYKIANL